MNAIIFGKRLKRLRKNRSITQKQFANRICVSVSTIRRYEEGVKFPDKPRLNSIANELNVSLDFLLGINQEEK